MSLLPRFALNRHRTQEKALEQQVSALRSALDQCKGMAKRWTEVRLEVMAVIAAVFLGIGFTLGFSWFAGSLVLALMILPTIASVAGCALAKLECHSTTRSTRCITAPPRWMSSGRTTGCGPRISGAPRLSSV